MCTWWYDTRAGRGAKNVLKRRKIRVVTRVSETTRELGEEGNVCFSHSSMDFNEPSNSNCEFGVAPDNFARV